MAQKISKIEGIKVCLKLSDFPGLFMLYRIFGNVDVPKTLLIGLLLIRMYLTLSLLG